MIRKTGSQRSTITNVITSYSIHYTKLYDFHMGISNELCSEKYDVTREDQDRYAAESYRRALLAIEAGKFKEEIMPVSIPQKKGDPLLFDRDECPRESSYESLARLKPVFKEGVITSYSIHYTKLYDLLESLVI